MQSTDLMPSVVCRRVARPLTKKTVLMISPRPTLSPFRQRGPASIKGTEMVDPNAVR